jgi:hypothetical protein
VSSGKECLEIAERAVRRMDFDVIRDIIAVVSERRREEWEQPNASDPQIS